MVKTSSALEKVEKLMAEQEQQIKALLEEAIAEKEAEYKEAVQAAEAVLAELNALRAKANKKPLGAKVANRKAGRKQRVSLETKRQYVADLLKGKFPRGGVSFANFKTALLDLKLESGSPVFAPTDVNSAVKFGKVLLPEGWKIVGERRDAKISRE
jgi:hypothetical protein